MKKKIIFGIVVLFLVCLTTASTITNRKITVTKERESKAIDLGIDVYDTIDYQKEGLFQRCLITLSNFSLPCSDFMEESELDKWEEDRMNLIFDVMIKRANRIEKIKIAEGQTVISAEIIVGESSIEEYYCSTKPSRTETCVCIVGTRCYYEICGESPWGVCMFGKWVKV